MCAYGDLLGYYSFRQINFTFQMNLFLCTITTRAINCYHSVYLMLTYTCIWLSITNTTNNTTTHIIGSTTRSYAYGMSFGTVSLRLPLNIWHTSATSLRKDVVGMWFTCYHGVLLVSFIHFSYSGCLFTELTVCSRLILSYLSDL